MTHPLTDEMIQSIWDKVGNDIVNATDEELVQVIDPWDDLMRTAYDLGFKAASQASEGAMKAPRRTFEEKQRSHKDPRKWGIKKRWRKY